MGVVEQVLNVFGEMAEWIPEAMTGVTSMFYTAEEGLTILGTLLICGLSVAVIIMIINLVISIFRWH